MTTLPVPPAQDSSGRKWHPVPADLPVDSPKKAGVRLTGCKNKGSANVSYKQRET